MPNENQQANLILIAKMQKETKSISVHEVRNTSKLKRTSSLDKRQLRPRDVAKWNRVHIQPISWFLKTSKQNWKQKFHLRKLKNCLMDPRCKTGSPHMTQLVPKKMAQTDSLLSYVSDITHVRLGWSLFKVFTFMLSTLPLNLSRSWKHLLPSVWL